MARSREDLELESRFVGIFRRMWITFSPRNTLQVIVFPLEINGTYNILTRTNAPIFKKIEDGENKRRVMDIDFVEKMVRDEMNKDEFARFLFKTQRFDLAIDQLMRYANDRVRREINQVK